MLFYLFVYILNYFKYLLIRKLVLKGLSSSIFTFTTLIDKLSSIIVHFSFLAMFDGRILEDKQINCPQIEVPK